MAPTTLLLFDVDGTLLLSGGASTRSMYQACRQVLGDRFKPAPIAAGTLDQQTFRNLAQHSGIQDPSPYLAQYKQTYLTVLKDDLERNPAGRALPGVLDLLNHLSQRPDIITGLLTGNFREGALLKISAVGINPSLFAIGAFAEDGAERTDLVPVALARASAIAGRLITPQQTILIGDTPRDIECAQATGCHVLAVATGQYSLEVLQSHHPDIAVLDLSDSRPLLQLIGSIPQG